MNSKKFDAFFTHDWGKDELNRDNHARVRQIVKALQQFGLNPWFDESEMTGDIVMQMAQGIDDSACVVVFVTQRYMHKVNAAGNDNCKREFDYASNRKGADLMIPVVMEARMSLTSSWEGKLGMLLGNILYVKAWDYSDVDVVAKLLLSEIVKRVPTMAPRFPALLAEKQLSSITAASVKPQVRVEQDLESYLASLNLDADVVPALVDMEIKNLQDFSLGVRHGVVTADALTRYGIKAMTAAKLLSNIPKIKLEFDGTTDSMAGHRWFYEGEAKNSKANGQGIGHLKLVNPAFKDKTYDLVYTGQWQDNLRHGQGTCVYGLTSANRFGMKKVVGQWQNDQPNGEVTIDYYHEISNYGIMYAKGKVVDWVFSGDFEAIYSQDSPNNEHLWKSFSGSLKDAKFHGRGKMIYHPGNVFGILSYEGEFNLGHFSGQGTAKYLSGTYTGQWANSVYHGQGTWTPTSGIPISGIWSNGTKI